jgi:hypothetical protein
MAQWAFRAYKELSRWKHMGDDYHPSSDEMKGLNFPGRRDMDFLHSHSNEDYMHSNVIDLEKCVKEMENIQGRGGPVGQVTEDEWNSVYEDQGQSNWDFRIDKKDLVSVDAEKEWELICGEERYEWEMI